MLLKFKHIKTRKVILDQLMTKFEVIMDQFIKEIGMVEHLFLVRLPYEISSGLLICHLSFLVQQTGADPVQKSPAARWRHLLGASPLHESETASIEIPASRRAERQQSKDGGV